MNRKYICNLSHPIFLILILLILMAITSAPGMTDIIQQCGDLKLVYSARRGINLTLDGIEIIQKSSYNVVLPDWSDVVFSIPKNPHLLSEATIKEDQECVRRITIPLRAEDQVSREKVIEGTETIMLFPNNAIRFQLELTLLADIATRFEWMAGAINANPIIGSSFEAHTGRGIRKGLIPIVAPPDDSPESHYANDIREFRLDTRLGTMIFHSDASTRLQFFDYRNNRWGDFQNPFLWLGRTSRPLEKGETIQYDLTIQFPERLLSVASAVPRQEFQVEVSSIQNALTPTLGKHNILIPKPIQVNFTQSLMSATQVLRIYLGEHPTSSLRYAANFLVEDLLNLYEIHPVVVEDTPPEIPLPGSILLGSGSIQELAASLCVEAGLETPEHEEGYALLVNDSLAVISANTEQGAFYGITTLLQLMTLDQNNQPGFKGAEIMDYPSLPFRGIHCFTSTHGAGEIQRAIRNLMARYKMNQLVWECQFLEWDSAPEIAHPDRKMSKSEARKVIATAQENFVEIIPLVQSLGHCEWMFYDGHNLDLAEDPETPYAYNPTNPDTYQFIFSIFSEAIELFQPSMFHIGHDEVTLTGRFPWRSRHTGKSATDLVMEDIEKLNTWFQEQEIEVMLWGDMFLADGEAPSSTYAPNREEAQKRRERLPKNIWVADWHYRDVEPEEYISLPLFKNLGNPVVGCSWYRPANIANQSIAARLFEVEGMLHTTWAGYNFMIDDFQSHWYQYMTYITAAHYFWSDDTTHPDDLSFHPQNVFLDTWFQEKPLLESRRGFTIDLTPVANRALIDTEQGEGWMGFGPEMDLSALTSAQNHFGTVYFDIPRTASGLQALLLNGKLNPRGNYPQAVEIELGEAQKATQLHFLITAAFPSQENANCGDIRITYQDGQSENLNLRYKRNLFASIEDWVGHQSRIAWKGKTHSGKAVRLWDLTWINPYPEKEIRSIQISSTGTEAAPVLLGITGVSE